MIYNDYLNPSDVGGFQFENHRFRRKTNVQTPKAELMHRVGAWIFSVLLGALVVSCGGGGGGQPAAVVVDVACAKTSCSSTAGTASAAAGALVWTYTNTNTSDASLNLNLTGLTAGQVVTLAYSNGAETVAASPGNGIAADVVESSAGALPVKSFVPDATQMAVNNPGDDAHSYMLEKNREAAKKLRSMQNAAQLQNANQADLLSVRAAPQYAPAINTQRTWIDFGTPGTGPTNYLTSVQATCVLPNGRNMVMWADAAAVSGSIVTASSIASFTNTYCGTGGAFARITALLGDVWGAGANKYGNLIQDGPALQDVNIVVITPGSNAQWAGYFYLVNNILQSPNNPVSNQALVFFINAYQLKADLNFTLSTLLHETTHMVNFYQRGVVRGNDHDTWLEETSAMMTEDIVAPVVIRKPDNTGYNKIIESRLPGYLGTGGAVSYINWATIASAAPNYFIGASFGAFLNRRYGIGIYQKLVTNCNDGTTSNTSYACLDALIKSSGGAGFADDFARFGASVFGTLPPVNAPAGYGYPAVTSGGYSLMPIDVPTLASQKLPANPAGLTNGFTATTHTYLRDRVTAGSYSRRNIVVPANTSVSVVVQ